MQSEFKATNWILGLTGALVGGSIGYLVLVWLYGRGIYALGLPGLLLGLGCGALFRGRSNVLSSICAVAGLVTALVAEWQMAPFVADASFGYFVAHLHQVRGVGLVAIALSAVFAFWCSRGRELARSAA